MLHCSGLFPKSAFKRFRVLQSCGPVLGKDSAAQVEPTRWRCGLFGPQPPDGAGLIVEPEQQRELNIQQHHRRLQRRSTAVNPTFPAPALTIPLQAPHRRALPAGRHHRQGDQQGRAPQQGTPIGRRRSMPPPPGDASCKQPAKQQ